MASYLDKKKIQLNGVTKFFSDTCQPPFTVYVETLWIPLGHLTLGLLSFGLSDILRGYLRPRGVYRIARTGRRRPRTRLGRFLAGGIPEIGEMIGKRLPFHDTLAARRISAGVRTLWIIDGFIQRILFWWLIFDLVTTFAYEWTTLIGESEACDQQHLTGSFLCSMAAYVCGRDARSNLPCGTLEKQWGTAIVGSTFATFGAPIGVSSVAVSFIPYPLAPPGQVLTGVDVWIADPANPDVPIGGSVQAIEQPDGKWSAIATATVTEGARTAAYCFPHGRAAMVTEGYLTGWCYIK